MEQFGKQLKHMDTYVTCSGQIFGPQSPSPAPSPQPPISPAAWTGSTGTGPAAAGSKSVGPAASTRSASAGPAACTGSGAGGFGPYSQEQVEQFVKQLKHMDMLGIDTYVTCSGEIFDREELRQVIKRFDR